MFDISLQDDNNQQIAKILTVDNRGKAMLFVHCGDRFTQTFYSIPLYRPYECITAVKWIHADQVLIGSSTGQAYLLNPMSTDEQRRLLTLCKQSMSGPLGLIKALCTTPIPHASDCALPAAEEGERIVHISTVDGSVYVCSHQQVCVWAISQTSEARVRSLCI